MATQSDSLAILGGSPAATGLEAPAWPPRSGAMAQRLLEIYWGGQWSFNLAGEERALCEEFATAHDARHGVFMANGTVTLLCALSVHGVGPGDEVIVPAFTCATSVFPVRQLGAKAVFVDVEPSTLCLDPAKLEQAITSRSKAIMPVHLYGSMADMEDILQIAQRHGLVVVEDCAHVHGGKWAGVGIGSLGHVGSFSFHQKKQIAAGEGGICICNDAQVAERLHRMIHIGYAPDEYGSGRVSAPAAAVLCNNLSATEFQAAIVRDQLRNHPAQSARYAAGAARFREGLSAVAGLRLQAPGRLASPQTYNKLLILFDRPPLQDIPLDLLLRAAQAEGVPLARTYGVVYRHPTFNFAPTQFAVPEDGCPTAEGIGADRGAVLPHPWLGADDSTIDAFVAAIAKVASQADALRELARRCAAAE